MVNKIVAVWGDEILDSRGHPTLRVHVRLQSGLTVSASVPSGASTGVGEAHELRDGDPQRYGGRGVLKALSNLTEIGRVLRDQNPMQQAQIDRILIDCDGTPDKSRLGANAIVGVSMAVARAAAAAANLPLYAYLADASEYHVPVPMMNVINGGSHASNGLDFQEYMIVPHGAPSFQEGLRWGSETHHAMCSLLVERSLATGVGDEGGFAPQLDDNEAPCALLVEAIERAGYTPGDQISLALDPAASSFRDDGLYNLKRSGGGRLDSEELAAVYSEWTKRYPIISIEDGFGDHDWAGFKAQCVELGSRIQIVGDDLYVSNRKLIEHGIEEKATNAVLIKLNQIGTVTETIQAIETCRAAGWNYIVSHRSGETNDAFIADFAVAMGGGQIKAGAPCRGERLIKYNRLLDIERELGARALYRMPSPERGYRDAERQRPHADVPTAHHEIVAIVEEASTARRCLTVAERAAHMVNGMTVTALHICVNPRKLVAAIEEVDIQRLRDAVEGTAEERQAHVREVFDDWAASTGISNVRWLEHTGKITPSLLEEVKGSALITIAQPHNLDAADALHAAIFNTGRLVLFVPTAGRIPETFGQHIAIAWKARPQARRAVQHAMPWLRVAERISIIAVNESGPLRETAEILLMLAEEGIVAEAHHVATLPREHIADRILAEAYTLGADTLVMGAYRFGDTFEWIFGGVTREVLDHSRLPVLLMH